MSDPKTSILIGIDLGGTNVRAGVITPEGRLLHWQDARIEAARGPEIGLRTITSLVEEVVSQVDQPIAGLGVGSTGPLDRQRGCIQNPYTLPGWEDVDIVSPMSDRFGVPVALENDADAAALGESWMGAGRGMARMTMVTIGTGVGFALVLDGEIYRGVAGEHPEGGHMTIDPSGPQCYCGARGCLESLVSGPAIAQFARSAEGLTSSSLYADCRGNTDMIEAGMVFEAARRGDDLSLRLVEQTAEYIGLGIVNIMMLLLPDMIVFTGGVVRSFDLLEVRIRSVIARHDLVIPASGVKLQPAQLGQQAGIFGAARAAQLLTLSSKP